MATTGLGTSQQHQTFENLMEGELTTLVETRDCEAGIKMLVETLKKQHVGNFAMQQ